MKGRIFVIMKGRRPKLERRGGTCHPTHPPWVTDDLQLYFPNKSPQNGKISLGTFFTRFRPLSGDFFHEIYLPILTTSQRYRSIETSPSSLQLGYQKILQRRGARCIRVETIQNLLSPVFRGFSFLLLQNFPSNLD